VKEANGAISFLKNAISPKKDKTNEDIESALAKYKPPSSINNSNCGGGGTNNGTTTAPIALKRKIVLVPMFFRLPPKGGPSSAQDDGDGKKKKEFIPAYRRAKEEGDADDDDDDDDDDEDYNNEAMRRKSNLMALSHKNDWKKWQLGGQFSSSGSLHDEDDDDSDDENSDGHLPHHRRSGSGRSILKRHSGRKTLAAAAHLTSKIKKLNNNKRRDTIPSAIDVSPLVKYLHWHPKDKRVCWDHRRTVRMAYDILRKKAVQELIDEREGKPQTSIAVFFEDYFFRSFGHIAKYENIT
jgi:hypothetical protein